MKTIQVGTPIEIDEKTATLLQRISQGEWDEIDREVLRSAVPDTNVFLKFLKRHNLTHTAEAKVVLDRLGIKTAEPKLAKAAVAAQKSRGDFVNLQAAERLMTAEMNKILQSTALAKGATGRAKAAAKKMRKAKRRKVAKSRRK
jgi:predicted nucleic acid-binding protein